VTKEPSDCPICEHLLLSHPLTIKEFPLSTLRLSNDQTIEGYCVLESKRHVTEVYDLGVEDQQTLMDELSQCARALKTVFQADKINYAFLGNKVPHMHWHLVPRQVTDPFWPESIWSKTLPPRSLPDPEYRRIIEAIRSAL
jgi:diadenosine tetraphosphate (Ap4A) HIT family hydrolase